MNTCDLNFKKKKKKEKKPSHCNDFIFFIINTRIHHQVRPSSTQFSANSEVKARFSSSECSSNINQSSSEMCVKDKYFHKGSSMRLFQKNAVCEAVASWTACPNPVLYQGKWKMLQIICEPFHYTVNRIYKLLENAENNLQLLEFFYTIMILLSNLSPRNSFSSTKSPLHSIRANWCL